MTDFKISKTRQDQTQTSLNLTPVSFHDPTGRLISTTLNSTTTDYVNSGDQLIGEYNAAGNPINLYVYAPGSDIPIARFSGSNGLNDMEYLRADERGSIVAETDGTSLLESHQYDVYGVPVVQSNSLFRYTGQIQLKGTELYHYKARAYHPGLGRFLQTDPIGYDDGMNMYAYVGNDPMNLVDPSGEEIALSSAVSKRPDGTTISTVNITFTAAIRNNGSTLPTGTSMSRLASRLEAAIESDFSQSTTDSAGNTTEYIMDAKISGGAATGSQHNIELVSGSFPVSRSRTSV